MMDERTSRDPLIDAFATLEPNTADVAACPPSEEIWDAVHGHLSAERTREIVEMAAENPAVAEAWRVAVQLGADDSVAENVGGDMTTRDPAHGVSRRRSGPWLALVAAVMLGVLGLWQLRIETAPVATTRSGEEGAIETLVANDSRLPRSEVRLRWRGGTDGARYDVRVFTEDLEPVVEAFDLTARTFHIAPDQLIPIEDGTRLLWQVIEYRLTGEESRSETFSVIVGSSETTH